MKLIKNLPTKINKNGKIESFGIFLCPFCFEEVERRLSQGKIQQSCGCIHNKNKNNPNYKHGFRKEKLYAIWDSIKQRCNNTRHRYYKNYGGRGITICPEWTDKENGFINFRDWVLSNGYQEGLEIDRRDNNGNYEPSNCRWVTHQINNQNQSTTKINIQIADEIRFKYNSGYYTQKQLIQEYNLSQTHIYNIINNKRWKNTLQI